MALREKLPTSQAHLWPEATLLVPEGLEQKGGLMLLPPRKDPMVAGNRWNTLKRFWFGLCLAVGLCLSSLGGWYSVVFSKDRPAPVCTPRNSGKDLYICIPRSHDPFQVVTAPPASCLTFLISVVSILTWTTEIPAASPDIPLFLARTPATVLLSWIWFLPWPW